METKLEPDIKGRIIGVKHQMETFDYFYSVNIGGMLLKYNDNLSHTIQTSHMSASEYQLAAALTTKTLTKVCTEEALSLFWERCKKAATELKINKPVLPRKKWFPIRYFLGEAPSEFQDNVKHYCRQIYFESIDTVVNCIKSHFEQKGHVKCYEKVGSTLMLAAKDEPFDKHILPICSFYGDDLDHHNLQTQPTLLRALFDGLNKDSIGIPFVINQLRELTQPQKNLLSEIIVLLKVLLLAPARNTFSERSCSTPRRIKTYLRSAMTQS